MAYPLTNVATSSDTFASWIDKTNQGLYVISTTAVTTAANTAGGLTTGNAVVNGTFSANILVANGTMRGGNVTTTGTLFITSFVDVQNSFINVVTTNANVTIGGSGKFANVTIPTEVRANLHIVTGTANLYVAATNADFATTKLNIVSDLAVWNVAGTGTKLFNVVSGSNVASFTVASLNTVATTISSNVTTSFTVNGGNTFITNSNTFIGNGSVNAVTITTNSTSTAVTLLGNSSTISSNLTINAANADIRNVTFNAANTTFAGSGNLVISTTAINATSNALLSGANITFTSATTVNLNGNAFFTADNQRVTFANTNIGTNVAAAQNVYTFAKASYVAAEVTAVAKSLSGNTQIIKMLVAHDGGLNVFSTVYGTIAAPNTANVGVFSTEINGSDVNIKFLQTAPNTSIKIVANLIK